MRTAIITAVGHDGKSVLLSGKEVSLLKQLERFKEAKIVAITKGAHEKYREISYQENDGHEELLTFRTPSQQKEHLAARAKEKDQHAAQLAQEQERENESRVNRPPNLREDGPTIAQFVEKGNDPKNYPPEGYAAKSTPQEIAQAISDKAAADKAAADKAAADKAALETVPGNEFKREELLTKDQGELLVIADGLVKSGRMEAPAKTSKNGLVEAILAAKPQSAASVPPAVPPAS